MYTGKTVLTIFIAVILFAACGKSDDSAAEMSDEPAETNDPYAAMSGDWLTEAFMSDSEEPALVVLLNASGETEDWTWKFTHIDEPLHANNVFLKGDTVVTEIGPYPSALKQGTTVDHLATYSIVNGGTLSGRFVASYSDGSEARGRLSGERVE